MSDINVGFESLKVVISSGIATFAAFMLNNLSNKRQEEKRFKDELSKIIQISIQYPELEDSSFTVKYPSVKSNNTNYLRYDSYCILIFNLLEQVSILYKFKKAKIEKFVYIEEWVNIHKAWWHFDEEGILPNQQGYRQKFIDIVNYYLKPS
jgi:hypothetical protein